MKYKHLHQVVPQDARQSLNDKILYLIDNDLAESSGITPEDIYNEPKNAFVADFEINLVACLIELEQIIKG